MPADGDQVADPRVAADLQLVDLGTAYFSRQLGRLTDSDYERPSLLPGWDKRHVIAHVGYNARALSRLVDWARTGVQTPMYASPEARSSEIDAGAALSPVELRRLHRDALDNLAAGWRDLPADRWNHPVRTAQGRTVPVSVTVWMRVREVWLHAVDLDNGGLFEDFPAEVIDRLLVDITSWWARSGDGADLVLEPTDRVVPELAGTSGRAGAVVVRGPAAQLTGWAAGRGGDVVTSTGVAVAAPRWL